MAKQALHLEVRGDKNVFMNEEFATDSAGDSPLQWFAVQVKPRAEKVVAAIAANKGYEEFLPLQKVRRRWSDRVKLLDLPLFPGYLFCKLRAENRLPLLTIPGVCGLIGVGKTPLPIEDAEIENIQAAVRSGLWAEPCAFLSSGQLVRLEEGPLVGMEGFYVESRKQHRIIVSVTLLKRSIEIEIERDWIRPLRTSIPSIPYQLASVQN